jgi:hypothetical protein
MQQYCSIFIDEEVVGILVVRRHVKFISSQHKFEKLKQPMDICFVFVNELEIVFL